MLLCYKDLTTGFAVFSLMSLSFGGCSTEEIGEKKVYSRYSKVLGKLGRIDVIRGGSGVLPNPELLLGIVSFSSKQSFNEIIENSGDGALVSTLNLSYQRTTPPTFSFSLGWNRSNEKVVVDGQTFSRKEGNIFVIHERRDGFKEIRQISSLICKEQGDDCIGVVLGHVSKHVTEFEEIVHQ